MRAEQRRHSDAPVSASAPRPERLLFVYSSASGVLAMLADAAKKAAGIEDCALCEVTHSPLGKRSEWARCERGLGISVTLVHRDELPASWELDVHALPCVLAQHGQERPGLLLDKDQIAACAGRVDALEALLRRQLDAD
jgi:hypothetical protein